MKFIIEQKLISFLRKQMYVFDENDEMLYHAKGNLRLAFKMYLYDKDEQVVLHIAKRYFKATPRYDIYINGERVARVIKKITFFKQKFKTRSNNEDFNKIRIDGDVIGKYYEISKDDMLFANINKTLLSVKNRYVFEVHDKENYLVYLGIMLAIDCMLPRRKRNR